MIFFQETGQGKGDFSKCSCKKIPEKSKISGGKKLKKIF